MSSSSANRPLSSSERALATWMLENGIPEAKEFLSQLDDVEVTPWRCTCGCASINFQLRGQPPAPPGVKILGEFLFGTTTPPFGAFIYENEGRLSGLEVYAFGGQAPYALPEPPLRPFA
jgi:hypothetical protein